jgi:hypothetical protein
MISTEALDPDQRGSVADAALFLCRTLEEKLDERELPYLCLVLAAFGGFMIAMIVATLREKAWVRRTGQKRL